MSEAAACPIRKYTSDIRRANTFLCRARMKTRSKREQFPLILIILAVCVYVFSDGKRYNLARVKNTMWIWKIREAIRVEWSTSVEWFVSLRCRQLPAARNEAVKMIKVFSQIRRFCQPWIQYAFKYVKVDDWIYFKGKYA